MIKAGTYQRETANSRRGNYLYQNIKLKYQLKTRHSCKLLKCTIQINRRDKMREHKVLIPSVI